jgi:hypothetical protein
LDRLQHQLNRLATGCVIALLGGGAACGTEAGARHAETVVDSIVPRDVALARFRSGSPVLAALSGGASSRDALVRAFVGALTTGDTATLRGLALSREEFGWLYYPTTPQSLPPYDLAPGLMWSMLELHSGRGLRRALGAYAGRSAAYVGHACDPQSSREGGNVVYGPCTVQLALGNDTVKQRLFGLIIERDGRFKFVSYTNTLD